MGAALGTGRAQASMARAARARWPEPELFTNVLIPGGPAETIVVLGFVIGFLISVLSKSGGARRPRAPAITCPRKDAGPPAEFMYG